MSPRLIHRSLAVLVQLVALAGLLVSGPSWARDYIIEKSYWTDPSGTAGFEQARLAQYTPYSGVLSKGFNRDAQWIRLKVAALPDREGRTLVLRIRPVFLDELALYDPADTSRGAAARTAGDRTALAKAEFDSLNHNFVIAAQPVPREIWLRLVTTSTQLVHVEALTPQGMLHDEHYLWLAYSALLAVLFSCLLWVCISWLQDRDPVNAAFVGRQSILLIYTVCYLGYHRIFFDGVLSAHQQDLLYGWTMLLTTALSLHFEYRLMREYAMPRWGACLLRMCLGVSLLLLALMLTGHTDTALAWNASLVALGTLSLLLVSLFLRPRSQEAAGASVRYLLPKRAVVGYYMLVVAVLAVSIMPTLGLLPGALMSIYGVMLYGLLSGLLMTVLLIVRSRQMERIRREEANHLYLSREQLAIETRRREDQSQLLSMLMHELKTPLAVIDLALKDRARGDQTQAYVSRAIDNMKSILNRCVQTERLVDRPFEVQTQRFDLAQQLRQWVRENKQAEGRVRLETPLVAPVHSDLQCVQIIAGNLIENALKYGHPRELVAVTLQAQERADGSAGLCLRVCNAAGPAGRPDADKVFVKYYRSGAAQRQSGTGLGLFLSHNLARQIGAELRYLPAETDVCFSLWLPT